MAMAVYSFDEADGMVQVCTELTVAPDDGLECSIVAMLWPIDGPKAGTFVHYDWCMISIHIAYIFYALFSSERLRLQCSWPT